MGGLSSCLTPDLVARSLRTCEAMVVKYQYAVNSFIIIIESTKFIYAACNNHSSCYLHIIVTS
jgi:hypothetical protein